jgi:hypothetical protein
MKNEELKERVVKYAYGWIFPYIPIILSIIAGCIAIYISIKDTNEKMIFQFFLLIIYASGILITLVLLIRSAKERNNIINSCDEQNLATLAEMMQENGKNIKSYESFYLFACGLHKFLERGVPSASYKMLKEFHGCVFEGKGSQLHFKKYAQESTEYRQKIAQLFIAEHKKTLYEKGNIDTEIKKIIAKRCLKDGNALNFMIRYNALYALKVAVVIIVCIVQTIASEPVKSTFFNIIAYFYFPLNY